MNEKWLRDGEGEMFIQVSRENQLMQWLGDVMSEESDSYKYRLISALATLDEKDLKDFTRVLTKMAGELTGNEQ